MDLSKQLDHLDNLIVKHVTGTAVTALRNPLSSLREQVEAFQRELLQLKNDHKVLKNLSDDNITRLEQEKAELIRERDVALAQFNELRDVASASNLKPATAEVLLYLFSRPDGHVSDFQVADQFRIPLNLCRYHLEILTNRDLARVDREYVDGEDEPTPFYGITSLGRTHVVEFGLLK